MGRLGHRKRFDCLVQLLDLRVGAHVETTLLLSLFVRPLDRAGAHCRLLGRFREVSEGLRRAICILDLTVVP